MSNAVRIVDSSRSGMVVVAQPDVKVVGLETTHMLKTSSPVFHAIPKDSTVYEGAIYPYNAVVGLESCGMGVVS